MKISDSRQIYLDRVEEIRDYLEFLRKSDPTENPAVQMKPSQQRILYSSVYLLLYNLVESTVNKSIEAVVNHIVNDDRWTVADLSERLLVEWTRSNAKTHLEMSYENRLRETANIIQEAFSGTKIKLFKIEKGGGGNWEDEAIFNFATKRLGMKLTIGRETNTLVKSFVKEKKGILAVIVEMRNELAHGNLSFGECGAGITVDELDDYAERVVAYLKEVVDSFEEFVANYHYLKPESRPHQENAS